jgi:50S ribosome-binding GTPase/Type II intron maturase
MVPFPHLLRYEIQFFAVCHGHHRNFVSISSIRSRLMQRLHECNAFTPLHQYKQKRRIQMAQPRMRDRDDEEYHAARAMRFMQENNPNVVINVENVRLATMKLLPRAADRIIQSAPIRIKVLTHVDTISDAALRQQIRMVQQLDERMRYPNQSPLAIFAMNLQSTEIKLKELVDLQFALFGASRLVSKPHMLVCGVPNSGKSSLILPLTKQRTITMRKKQEYHLPRISSKAGMTLGVKKHQLPPPLGTPYDYVITLIDMPGFRPKLLHAEPSLVTLLLSAGVTEPFQGYKAVSPNDHLIKLLLRATNRHAEMTDPNAPPDYVTMLNLKEPTEDVNLFVKAYCEWSKTQPDIKSKVFGHNNNPEQMYWPRAFQSGVFGGLIFTPYTTLPYPGYSAHLQLNRDRQIVYMNEEAERLMKIGRGMINATKVEERPIRSVLLSGKQAHDAGQDDDPNKVIEPVIYPPHQRSFKCLQCAEFVRLGPGEKVFGRRHGRACGWSYNDILCYFSRMTEAFGGMYSKRLRYLMKDSLACTLAIKHKLRSRAAAYKKFHGIPEYPVPNHLRPKRFQIDQPIPFIHFCTRKVGSCRTMTEQEVRRETEKLERLNVADHTNELRRKRGQRPLFQIHKATPKKPPKLGPDGKPLLLPVIPMKNCVVQTIGPLAALPRFDRNGAELRIKNRNQVRKNLLEATEALLASQAPSKAAKSAKVPS